jgi:hypothetical protein
MEQLLNTGIVVFDNAFNALPVFVGLVMVVVGLLGLAIIRQLPGADFSKGDGAGMEGPAPLPNEAELPEWEKENGEGVSCLRTRPGLSGRPGPSEDEKEGEGHARGAGRGECVSQEAGSAAEADEDDAKGNG